MDTSSPYTFKCLFDQLGLPSDDEAVADFIERHRGLAPETELAEAPFWNRSQRDFLHRAIDEDADWAEIVDKLDAQLRH